MSLMYPDPPRHPRFRTGFPQIQSPIPRRIPCRAGAQRRRARLQPRPSQLGSHYLQDVRLASTVFASSALRTPHSPLKTAPSAIRSPPSANCSARSRDEPRDSQVDPAIREPCRRGRDLIPVVCEVGSGRNSTVWGFREAENTCFSNGRRGFSGIYEVF